MSSIQCPFCAERIPAAATVCPHCEKKLPDIPPSAVSPRSASELPAGPVSLREAASGWLEYWKKEWLTLLIRLACLPLMLLVVPLLAWWLWHGVVVKNRWDTPVVRSIYNILVVVVALMGLSTWFALLQPLF